MQTARSAARKQRHARLIHAIATRRRPRAALARWRALAPSLRASFVYLISLAYTRAQQRASAWQQRSAWRISVSGMAAAK